MSSSVRALLALDPQSVTRQEFRAGVDAVIADWERLKTSLTTAAEADRERIEAAFADLQKAIDDLPRDVPIREALATVRPQALAVVAAVRQAADHLGCS